MKRKIIWYKVPFMQNVACGIIHPFYGLGWIQVLMALIWTLCFIAFLSTVSVHQVTMALGCCLVYRSSIDLNDWITNDYEAREGD